MWPSAVRGEHTFGQTFPDRPLCSCILHKYWLRQNAGFVAVRGEHRYTVCVMTRSLPKIGILSVLFRGSGDSWIVLPGEEQTANLGNA